MVMVNVVIPYVSLYFQNPFFPVTWFDPEDNAEVGGAGVMNSISANETEVQWDQVFAQGHTLKNSRIRAQFSYLET